MQVEGEAIPSKEDLVDITALVTECAESLTVSDPFLCDESTFSLQDAMAATQLMDRKMDCCEIPISLVAPYGREINDTDRTIFPRPTPSGLDGPFTPLKWENLTSEDVLFISLEMLVQLTSLLGGASVGESTFTCLYSHASVLTDMHSRLFPRVDGITPKMGRLMTLGKPEGTTAQLSLFASALALVELTQVIRGIITNADIYEEEDFVASTNQIPFYTEQDKSLDALDVLEVAIKNVKSAEQSDITRALENTLSFQHTFLTALSKLAKLESASLQKEVSKMKDVATSATNSLDELLAVIELLKNGQGSSEPVKATLHQAFDSYVNRPLFGNAPVRKVFFRETKEAVTILRKISFDLQWAVCDFILKGNSLGRVQRMLDRLAPKDVNIVCRSLVILNLYFDNMVLGQFPIRQVILADLKQWMHIPESLLANEHSQSFLNRLAKPIYDTLKLRTLNRNRQRAYIELVMLPDWAALQDEANLVDLHYRQMNNLDNTTPPHFSQYVLTVVIRLMERSVAAGIELELFHSHEELSFAFWYRDFLLSALLNNLTLMKRARSTAAEIKSPGRHSTAKSGRGKKKGPKNKPNGNVEVGSIPEDKEDEVELGVITLKRHLCRGTIRFLAALRQAGILQTISYEFTSLERIFEERFQSFHEIRQPPPLSYQHYLEGSDFSKVKPEDLLQTTMEWFQSCKKTTDQLLGSLAMIDPVYSAMSEEDMHSLQKVCVGNSVYLMKLRQIQGQAKDEKQKAAIDMDFSAHEQFCILKLS